MWALLRFVCWGRREGYGTSKSVLDGWSHGNGIWVGLAIKNYTGAWLCVVAAPDEMENKGIMIKDMFKRKVRNRNLMTMDKDNGKWVNWNCKEEDAGDGI